MTVQYNSNYDLTLPFSDSSAQIDMQVGVVEIYTVPGDAEDKYSAKFMYNADSVVFCRLNAAPTVPAAGTVNTESNCELKPGYDGTQRYVKGGDTLNFISPDATAYVGISLRKLP